VGHDDAFDDRHGPHSLGDLFADGQSGACAALPSFVRSRRRRGEVLRPRGELGDELVAKPGRRQEVGVRLEHLRYLERACGDRRRVSTCVWNAQHLFRSRREREQRLRDPNQRHQGLTAHPLPQVCNGPLFGADGRRMLLALQLVQPSDRRPERVFHAREERRLRLDRVPLQVLEDALEHLNRALLPVFHDHTLSTRPYVARDACA
jgi:hypothetical protein